MPEAGGGDELVVLVVRPARRRFQVVGGIVGEGSAVGVGVCAIGLKLRQLRVQASTRVVGVGSRAVLRTSVSCLLQHIADSVQQLIV